MGLVYTVEERGAIAPPSLPFARVVPQSGRVEQDETGQWYVLHGQHRHRGSLLLCEGCGDIFLCSSGTKKKNRRHCSRACGCRNSPTQRGYGKPAGATRLTDDGYVREKVADGRWRRQHRLVMERQLGRPLMEYETVHHRDGDRANNDPENLQLRVGAHGKGQVVCCLDCGSENVGFGCL